jgi:hypothetical protein
MAKLPEFEDLPKLSGEEQATFIKYYFMTALRSLVIRNANQQNLVNIIP